MRLSQLIGIALLCACLGGGIPSSASAQILESVGTRALGMGGAFVAVASDASATWWNPAGLAAGPFLDLTVARASTGAGDRAPAWRDRTSWFAIATPPFGFGYYRFRLTDIQPFSPTDQAAAGREDRGVGIPARSLSASQLGVTVVQTVTSGIHAGSTLKYLRGTPSGGDTQGRFDLDAGVLAIAGSLRVGAVVRNVTRPEFNAPGAALRLPRQFRVGAAFDPERATGVPLTISLDADVRAYDTGTGERRVVAAGAEQWFKAKRFGVRGGGRFNTVGLQERSVTAGATVAVRSGLYVEGYVVRGGPADEQGWGLAARISF